MRVKPFHIILVLSIFISFVFVQSLFFKYTNSVETQHIFGTLDAWASTFGLQGLFAQTGLFSQHVIGTAELVASSLLIAGLILRWKVLTGLGALLAVAIISGAIVFHLFTPLGVEVQGDGGLLFGMACGVWLSGATLAYLSRGELARFLGVVAHSLAEPKPASA